jgi:hypothetical protein
MSQPLTKKYIPLFEKFSDRELCWRLAERDMIRRERFRRILRGIIKPYYKMKPQMMIKNKQGGWVPEVKGLTQ